MATSSRLIYIPTTFVGGAHSTALAASSVAIVPGATAFTRMPLVCQGQCHHAGELVDAALADVVAGDGGNGQHAVDGTHVDDRTARGSISQA